MPGLPTKYAKMGFKRGWAAFNKSHRKKKKRGNNGGIIKMVKRRKSSKKSRSRSKGGLGVGAVSKVLIGASVAALYEVFVSPMIPLDAMIKNILELVLGLVLATMPGVPSFIRAGGVALATINAFALVYPLISGVGASSGGNSTSWNY